MTSNPQRVRNWFEMLAQRNHRLQQVADILVRTTRKQLSRESQKSLENHGMCIYEFLKPQSFLYMFLKFDLNDHNSNPDPP